MGFNEFFGRKPKGLEHQNEFTRHIDKEPVQDSLRQGFGVAEDLLRAADTSPNGRLSVGSDVDSIQYKFAPGSQTPAESIHTHVPKGAEFPDHLSSLVIRMKNGGFVRLDRDDEGTVKGRVQKSPLFPIEKLFED